MSVTMTEPATLSGPDGALATPMDTVEATGLAELFQALGDPTRLRMLSALDTACVPVGSIVAATGLRQPTVSHHSRVLHDRGLVRAERSGAFVFYCAASEVLGPAVDAARALLEDRPSALPTPANRSSTQSTTDEESRR